MTSLSTQLDISALVEMGFTKDRVELAVKSVKNPDIQTVIEWLFNHPLDDSGNNGGHRLGDNSSSSKPSIENNGSESPQPAEVASGVCAPVENDESATNENQNSIPDESSESPAADASALSLVCEDCGKQIRNEMDAQTHAARTGHQNFAESAEPIKPLTEEEKEAQKLRLKQKLDERRKEREFAEKEQEKEREKIRRKTGQEVTQAKEEQAYKEMKRIAEERRQEKLEEKRLKQKLREEIARDREQFKKQNIPTNVTVSDTPKAAEAVTDIPTKKEYTTARIQFRLVDGSTQSNNFNADDLLQVVYDYTSQKIMNTAFELGTTFPRRIFSEADRRKTMRELGLVPSAALVLKKCS